MSSTDRAWGFTHSTTAPDAVNAVLARNWWAVLIRGILAIVFAVIAFAVPTATMLALVLVFAAYMLLDGVFAIVAAVRAARRQERWGLLAFEGMVDFLTAVIAVVWPGITVLAFVLLIGAWALVTGGLMLAAALRIKLDHGRWWFALAAIASIAFGVLLLIAPLIGAIVLTWWLGAYALLFGIILCVVAFMLRAHRNDHPAMATNRMAA
jgi:uncharacterized membrane protein HdeD (DUF308 family)